MASGAEVMTMFIMAKLATPQATATTKRGVRAISDSGRLCSTRAAATGGTFTNISTSAAITAQADWPR